MNSEFNWWLLIVGLVIGAGLVWLILADGSRRDADVATRERAGEARWIAEELRRAGSPIVVEEVAVVLELHAAYLAGPPPDEPAEDRATAGSVAAMDGGAAAPPQSPSAAASDEAWPVQSPTGGSTLPRRSTIAQSAGQARGDGDGLPV